MRGYEAFGLDTWRLLQRQGLPPAGYVTQLHGNLSPASVRKAYINELTVMPIGPMPSNDLDKKMKKTPSNAPSMGMNMSKGPSQPKM